MKKTSDTFSIQGEVRITKTRAGTNEILWQSPWMKNRIVNNSNRGVNLVVQRLIGVNTYTLNIDYGELGTSAGSPTAADIGLGTPTSRVAYSLRSIGAALNIAQLQFYWTDAQLANATYREFGTFSGGTTATATGQLFNHILFSTVYTKAAGEDTTVEVNVTVA